MDSTVVAAVIGAGATLATGFAAVAAAFASIGAQMRTTERQVKITERQTDIQERQLNLVDTANRIELFDRRMIAYHDAQDYVYKFTEFYTGAGTEFMEREAQFIRHINESRFLFNDKIFDWMKQVYVKKEDYRSAMNSLRQSTDKETSEKMNSEMQELYDWSVTELFTMHKTFAPFLTIVVKPSPPTDSSLVADAIQSAKTL